MDDTLPVLTLKRGEDRRLRAGHLWVFSNEVDTTATPLAQFARGALAIVQSDRKQFLGYAYVNPNALICARIVSRDPAQPLERALLVRRLRVALALRERLYRAPYYRLVYGESDGLPGLVLDRFGDVVVGQSATAGMDGLAQELAAVVQQVLAPRALVWKNDSGARDLEELPRTVSAAFGEMPAELSVHEGDCSFTAPLAGGQKTGWFYDQTANRARLTRYLAPGARVLDVCSYVGAWAVTALKHGARSATCVDSSEPALAYALRNAAANGVQVTTLRDDAFDALKALQASGERFDVIVLDPPAFIKRRKDLPQGQAAYRKLNQLALPLIEPDGLLVSCSCSYHLAPDDLLSAIQAAARHSSRFLQVLESGGQSPDHPVHPAIPETRYLKAFFCRVTRE
ncbi:MAG TPA: class I SAM-dependent rRNA methyltransferase [Steroidobacteraceae bacterium]